MKVRSVGRPDLDVSGAIEQSGEWCDMVLRGDAVMVVAGAVRMGVTRLGPDPRAEQAEHRHH